MVSLRSRRTPMLARCVRCVSRRNWEERRRGMNAEIGVMGGGGVTSRRKVRPGNISRCGRTKGDTMPRAGSILLAREKRIADGRTRLRGYVARETPRDRATLLPKRCSPLGLGKQRATGLPRDVINHFLLRKAKREREREGGEDRKRKMEIPAPRVGKLLRIGIVDGLAPRFSIRTNQFKIVLIEEKILRTLNFNVMF